MLSSQISVFYFRMKKADEEKLRAELENMVEDH